MRKLGLSSLVLATLLFAGCPPSAPDSDGGPPADAGKSNDDAGAPNDDAGAPNNDAGAPNNDAGAPNDDAGAPNNDAGAPNDDAGAPSDDAGAPSDDAGTPNNDAGTPNNDAGTPNNDAGTPNNDAGTPNNDAGTPNNDAGTPNNDAGTPNNDAGTPNNDAGPAGLAEGADCSAGDVCAEGLACYTSRVDDTSQLCREDCGVYDATGALTATDATLCEDPARPCQVVRNPTAPNEFTGAFCLPQVATRDAACEAPYDSGACADDRTCNFSSDGFGLDAARCRDACDLTAADPDAACLAGESCQPDPLVGADFAVCGVTVAWAQATDFAATFPGQKSCNELDGHRLCDRLPVQGLTNPADVRCFAGFLDQAQPNQGFCFPICRFPAFDRNFNGAIEAAEAATDLECPTGFSCTADLSRATGLGNFPTNASGELIPCDPAQCPPGQLCGTCGGGDSECLTFSTGSFCYAPLGSCAPTP